MREQIWHDCGLCGGFNTARTDMTGISSRDTSLSCAIAAGTPTQTDGGRLRSPRCWLT